MKQLVLNQEKVDKAKSKILKDGAKKLHILADFDRTITKTFVNGKEVRSLMEFFRSNEKYISKDYAEKSTALANFYRLIEQDPVIPLEEKKVKMEEWWTKHFDPLIESGLNKKHLKTMIENAEKEGFLEFREGFLELLDMLKEKDIPLVIISSSGLGVTIEMFLEKYKKMYKNVHVITNEYIWDEKGNAIGVKKPIIHVFNKDESSINKFPKLHEELKERKNVILLGDSLGDLGMISGFDYDTLLSFGFLEDNVEKNMPLYEQKYSIILTENPSFSEINKLVKKVK
ncbi:MAG: haloacid dehalogenase-like hydrolase [archaeon]